VGQLRQQLAHTAETTAAAAETVDSLRIEREFAQEALAEATKALALANRRSALAQAARADVEASAQQDTESSSAQIAAMKELIRTAKAGAQEARERLTEEARARAMAESALRSVWRTIRDVVETGVSSPHRETTQSLIVPQASSSPSQSPTRLSLTSSDVQGAVLDSAELAPAAVVDRVARVAARLRSADATVDDLRRRLAQVTAGRETEVADWSETAESLRLRLHEALAAQAEATGAADAHAATLEDQRMINAELTARLESLSAELSEAASKRNSAEAEVKRLRAAVLYATRDRDDISHRAVATADEASSQEHALTLRLRRLAAERERLASELADVTFVLEAAVGAIFSEGNPALSVRPPNISRDSTATRDNSPSPCLSTEAAGAELVNAYGQLSPGRARPASPRQRLAASARKGWTETPSPLRPRPLSPSPAQRESRPTDTPLAPKPTAVALAAELAHRAASLEAALEEAHRSMSDREAQADDEIDRLQHQLALVRAESAALGDRLEQARAELSRRQADADETHYAAVQSSEQLIRQVRDLERLVATLKREATAAQAACEAAERRAADSDAAAARAEARAGALSAEAGAAEAERDAMATDAAAGKRALRRLRDAETALRAAEDLASSQRARLDQLEPLVASSEAKTMRASQLEADLARTSEEILRLRSDVESRAALIAQLAADKAAALTQLEAVTTQLGAFTDAVHGRSDVSVDATRPCPSCAAAARAAAHAKEEAELLRRNAADATRTKDDALQRLARAEDAAACASADAEHALAQAEEAAEAEGRARARVAEAEEEAEAARAAGEDASASFARASADAADARASASRLAAQLERLTELAGQRGAELVAAQEEAEANRAAAEQLRTALVEARASGESAVAVTRHEVAQRVDDIEHDLTSAQQRLQPLSTSVNEQERRLNETEASLAALWAVLEELSDRAGSKQPSNRPAPHSFPATHFVPHLDWSTRSERSAESDAEIPLTQQCVALSSFDGRGVPFDERSSSVSSQLSPGPLQQLAASTDYAAVAFQPSERPTARAPATRRYHDDTEANDDESRLERELAALDMRQATHNAAASTEAATYRGPPDAPTDRDRSASCRNSPHRPRTHRRPMASIDSSRHAPSVPFGSHTAARAQSRSRCGPSPAQSRGSHSQAPETPKTSSSRPHRPLVASSAIPPPRSPTFIGQDLGGTGRLAAWD
jgi:uncharacterized coiled-coil protein SlyX